LALLKQRNLGDLDLLKLSIEELLKASELIENLKESIDEVEY